MALIVTNPWTRRRLENMGFDPDSSQAVSFAQTQGLALGEQPETGFLGNLEAFGAGAGRGLLNTVIGVGDLPFALGRAVGLTDTKLDPLSPTAVELANPFASTLGNVGQLVGTTFLGGGAILKAASMLPRVGNVYKTAQIAELAASRGLSIRQALTGAAGLTADGLAAGNAVSLLGGADKARLATLAWLRAQPAESGLLAGLSTAGIGARAFRTGTMMGVMAGTQPGDIDQRFVSALQGALWGGIAGGLGASPGMARSAAALREGLAGALTPPPFDSPLPAPLTGFLFGAGLGGILGGDTRRRQLIEKASVTTPKISGQLPPIRDVSEARSGALLGALQVGGKDIQLPAPPPEHPIQTAMLRAIDQAEEAGGPVQEVVAETLRTATQPLRPQQLAAEEAVALRPKSGEGAPTPAEQPAPTTSAEAQAAAADWLTLALGGGTTLPAFNRAAELRTQGMVQQEIAQVLRAEGFHEVHAQNAARLATAKGAKLAKRWQDIPALIWQSMSSDFQTSMTRLRAQAERASVAEDPATFAREEGVAEAHARSLKRWYDESVDPNRIDERRQEVDRLAESARKKVEDELSVRARGLVKRARSIENQLTHRITKGKQAQARLIKLPRGGLKNDLRRAEEQVAQGSRLAEAQRLADEAARIRTELADLEIERAVAQRTIEHDLLAAHARLDHTIGISLAEMEALKVKEALSPEQHLALEQKIRSQFGQEGMENWVYHNMPEDLQLAHTTMRLNALHGEPGVRSGPWATHRANLLQRFILSRDLAMIRRNESVETGKLTKKGRPAKKRLTRDPLIPFTRVVAEAIVNPRKLNSTETYGSKAFAAISSKIRELFGSSVKLDIDTSYDFDPNGKPVNYLRLRLADGTEQHFLSEDHVALFLDSYVKEISQAPDLTPALGITIDIGKAIPITRAPDFMKSDGEVDGLPVDRIGRSLDRYGLNFVERFIRLSEATFLKIDNKLSKELPDWEPIYPKVQRLFRRNQLARINADAALQQLDRLRDKYGVQRTYRNEVEGARFLRAVDEIAWREYSALIRSGADKSAAYAAIWKRLPGIFADHRTLVIDDKVYDFLTSRDYWSWVEQRCEDFGLERHAAPGYFTRLRMSSQQWDPARPDVDPLLRDVQMFYAAERRVIKRLTDAEPEPFNPLETQDPRAARLRQDSLTELGLADDAESFFGTWERYTRIGYRALYVADPVEDLQFVLSRSDQPNILSETLAEAMKRLTSRAMGVPSKSDVLTTEAASRRALWLAKQIAKVTNASRPVLPQPVIDSLTNVYQTLGLRASRGEIRSVADTYTSLHRAMIFGVHVGRTVRDLATTQILMAYPRFQTRDWAPALKETWTPRAALTHVERYVQLGWLKDPAFFATDATGDVPWNQSGPMGKLDRLTAMYRSADLRSRLLVIRATERAVLRELPRLQRAGHTEAAWGDFLANTGLDTYGGVTNPAYQAEIRTLARRGDLTGVMTRSVEIAQSGIVGNFTRMNSMPFYDSAVGRFFGQYGSWSLNTIESLRWLMQAPFKHHSTPRALQRSATIAAKYATAAMAVYSLGAAVGADTSDWIPFLHNLYYAGGPGLTVFDKGRALLGGDPIATSIARKDPGGYALQMLRRLVPIPAGDMVRRMVGQTGIGYEDPRAYKNLGLIAPQRSMRDRMLVALGFNPFHQPLTKYQSPITQLFGAPPRYAADKLSELSGGFLPPGSYEKAAGWGKKRKHDRVP